MTSAVFELSTDNGATWKASDLPLTGANALAPSASPIVVKARLSSQSGVSTVDWSTPTADDATIENGALPQPVQAADKSCTLTLPANAAGGRAYVLQAKINGGHNNRTNVVEDPAYTRRLAIHVKTTNGVEVISAAEYDEANRAYGWTGSLNGVARAVSAGGGGGTPATNAPPAVASAGAAGVATAYAREDHTHAGVTSFNGTQGAVVATIPAAGGAPPDVAGAASAGVAATYSKSDHTHAGVTSFNGSQGAVVATIPTAGGTPPAIAGAGAAGVAATFSRSDHTHAGVTSVNGSQGAVSGTFAPTPGGTGDRDKIVVANATGSALGLIATLWLTAARVNAVGGSVANDTFGSAPVQSTGDATNGEAFGARAAGASPRAAYALYSSANVAMGQLAYDETGDRVLLRGNSKSVVVATDAAETKVALRVEGNSFNVGVCGATAYGTSGDGVFAIGLAAVAPSTNPANTLVVYNSGGNGIASCTGSMALAVGNVVKIRATTAESALVGLISLGQTGGSFGGATGTAVYLKNCTAAPGTNPSGGGVLYAEAGALKWRGSAGTVTQLAAA